VNEKPSDTSGTVDAHAHSPGFLKLIAEASAHVESVSIEEYLALREHGESYVLIDTREEHEWNAGHLPGAIHLGKGIIERDIEAAVPDPATPIVAYCGGGYRSVLVCENLQRMGYTHCLSLDGGWRGWNKRGLPVVTPESSKEAE
jgi:rhodanese-related sulfurtransferase